MQMLFEKIEQLEKENKLLRFRIRIYRLLALIVFAKFLIDKLL